MLLALAARHGWKVRQFDAKSAFTNPKLDREIYMRIPAGADGHGTEDVWLLHRALYGLKQACANGTTWSTKLSRILATNAAPSITIHGLFYKNIDGELVIIAVWVDDFINVSPSDKAINILRDQFGDKFEIVDLERSSGF